MDQNKKLLELKKIPVSPKVAQFFQNRFSPRFFQPSQIPEKDIQIIFQAVKLTPSSYNFQPWYFYLFQQENPKFKQIANLLIRQNRWAEKAPLLILACYLENSPYGKNDYAQYDLGQAVISLVYQAQILGYYSHQIAGFDRQKAKLLVKDKNHIPFVIIALGKIGNYNKAPKEIIEKDYQPRNRKNDFVKTL